jgi:catechol 2,3-dioxygenase-like lactoylglutathione lyase family enzyme
LITSPAPPRLAGLDHLVLRASDLGAMTRFYCDVVGCTIDRERPDLGLVHLRAGRSLIDLVSIDGPLGSRGGQAAGAEGRNLEHFCLTLNAFDESKLRGWLAAKGVEILESGPRYGAEGQGTSLYIRDPEGHRRGTEESRRRRPPQAARMMPRKSSALSDAPPTRAPPTSAARRISSAFAGFTEPP